MRTHERVIHKLSTRLPLALITGSIKTISKPNTKSPVLVGGKGKIMSCDNHEHEETVYTWGNMDCPRCVAQAIDNGSLDFSQFGSSRE